MNNDRELLELAAKAAGIQHSGPKGGAGLWVGHAAGMKDMTFTPRWNPLKDDGDALRLAVKLGFINSGQWPSVSRVAERMLLETGKVDWCSATRRAIVLAAAEIGRMK